MKHIAIFASGGGSNAQKIIEHFQTSIKAEVSLIISNKMNAGVLEKAASHNISTLVLDRKDFYESDNILQKLDAYSIDFVVLAGFLWLIPTYLVKAYSKRIVNIHPALLPKYGGKGMYGMNVHQAVKKAGDKETGMTIHYVNEHYDEGATIFQEKCQIDPTDSSEDIARKVLQLEHHHYPKIIEKLVEAL